MSKLETRALTIAMFVNLQTTGSATIQDTQTTMGQTTNVSMALIHRIVAVRIRSLRSAPLAGTCRMPHWWCSSAPPPRSVRSRTPTCGPNGSRLCSSPCRCFRTFRRVLRQLRDAGPFSMTEAVVSTCREPLVCTGGQRHPTRWKRLGVRSGGTKRGRLCCRRSPK